MDGPHSSHNPLELCANVSMSVGTLSKGHEMVKNAPTVTTQGPTAHGSVT